MSGQEEKLPGISICIFIDAFGWELLDRHSFLDDMLPVKQPLDTIFGYSATCDPTILTGLLPRDHGHFSFFVYDPDHSPFRRMPLLQLMRLVPKALSSRNRARSVIGKLINRQLAYTGYFNIYNMPFNLMKYMDYTEKRDLYQPGGINSGSPTIMDYARDQNIDFFLSDWKASEEQNLKDLTDAVLDPRRDCRFAYLYMASMDAVLHRVGTDHPEVSAKIAWYEQQIRALIRTAQSRYREVRFFIFSDHGMTDVHDTCDVQGPVAASGLKFGQDYAAVYDSTMARFWFFNSQASRRIEEILKGLPCGEVLTDQQLSAWGVDFPDRRYGELFFLMHPGVLLLPSHMGDRPIAGMHGYSPEDKDSAAAFCSSCALDLEVSRLDDLYGLMKGEIDRWLSVP